MADTRIEIIVSGEQAEEVARQLAGVVPADAEIVAPAGEAPGLADLLAPAIAASAELPAKFSDWYRDALGGADAGVLLPLVLAALVLVVAYAIDFGASRLVRGVFVRDVDAEAVWTERVSGAFGWTVLQALRVVIFYAASHALAVALLPPERLAVALVPVLLEGALRFRIVLVVLEMLAASRAPNRRPSGLTNSEANVIFRGALPLVVTLGVLASLRAFNDTVVGAGDSAILFAIASRGIEFAAGFAYFVFIRRPITRLLRLAFASPDGDGALSGMMGYWPVLYGLLLVLTFLTDTMGRLADPSAGSAVSASYSFQIFILTPFLLAGLGIWGREVRDGAEDERKGILTGLFALLEGAVIVLAAVLLLFAWNIDPFAQEATGAARILPGLVSASLTIVVGIAVWRTVSAFLDVYAPASGDADGDIPDGEGGRAGNRLETLFPVFRIAAGILVGLLTVMLALTSLGVQIAPLLAGAGILGLAFGFGAQTLVKDVIAGMFYLYEDAFRLGEFIESAEGKGAVEKIMLRSVRLRHPRGPVTTIPFGSLGTIKNHSRDWVTVKFSFEVGPGEDLERVRKLVKKVGLALAENPELEGKFIEPLKSQGAIGMVGENFQIGVKFTCPPGEQFAIRRRAFIAIQKGLRDNGVQIPTPRVVVDSREPEAAAGAVAATSGALSEPQKSA